jgi:hypothetical protein
VRWTFAVSVLGLAATLVTACGDSTGALFNPVMVNAEVTVAAPLPQNATLPTALDVMSDGAFGVQGGRFPETVRDALEWDFAVRIRNGALVLIPARGIGVVDSRAGLTEPLVGQTLESLREAPGARTFIMDTPVVMQTGNVHAARSRESRGGFFGFGCVQYSKFQVLEANPATGILRVQVVTNERCGDPRLVPVE